MNRKQTLQTLAILQGAYPFLYKDMSNDDLDGVVSLWEAMFAEDDPKLVAAGVKAFIATDTKGFWPSIGQIKEKMRQITDEEVPTAMEAWTNIWETVDKHRGKYLDAFNDLPPIVRSILGSSSTIRAWGEMDVGTLESVVSSNFQKSYREKVKAKQTFDALPSDVRNQFAPEGKAAALEGNTVAEVPRRKRFKTILNEDGNWEDVEVNGDD